MGNGLVGGILHQADAAIIDFIHAVGILRHVAGGSALKDNYIQSGSGSYFFSHHEAAPPAADHNHIRGFQALQPGTIPSAAAMECSLLDGYLQRKMRSAITKGTTNHASNIATCAVCWLRFIPCSILPRMASMAAVSGRALTTG